MGRIRRHVRIFKKVDIYPFRIHPSALSQEESERARVTTLKTGLLLSRAILQGISNSPSDNGSEAVKYSDPK